MCQTTTAQRCKCVSTLVDLVSPRAVLSEKMPWASTLWHRLKNSHCVTAAMPCMRHTRQKHSWNYTDQRHSSQLDHPPSLSIVFKQIIPLYLVVVGAFSALMLLAGQQEGQKNWVVGCWRGYLSGARCRLSAYGPADATASIPKPHHLLPQLNPDWFYLSGTSLPRLSWARSWKLRKKILRKMTELMKIFRKSYDNADFQNFLRKS